MPTKYLSPLGPAEWLFKKKFAWRREGGFKREKVLKKSCTFILKNTFLGSSEGLQKLTFVVLGT